MSCNCKPVLRPKNLAVPLVDLYVARLSNLELTEVSRRSMVLMNERTSHGLQDAALCWGEALLSLFLQKGWLRSIDQLEADETSLKSETE